MEKDGEPIDAIVKDGDVLGHVHTADTDRYAPGTGVYDHAAMFRALKAAGYDGRVSIECGWKDFAAEIGPALAHLMRAHQSS
jgi:sugar phosphate isomerase/epimerase